MIPATFSPSLCLCAFLFRIVLEYRFVHSAPVYSQKNIYEHLLEVRGVASSLGFSRQEYWRGLPSFLPGDRQWCHSLYGHDFEQTLGEGVGQGSLARCSPWGRKEWDWATEQLNLRENSFLSPVSWRTKERKVVPKVSRTQDSCLNLFHFFKFLAIVGLHCRAWAF